MNKVVARKPNPTFAVRGRNRLFWWRYRGWFPPQTLSFNWWLYTLGGDRAGKFILSLSSIIRCSISCWLYRRISNIRPPAVGNRQENESNVVKISHDFAPKTKIYGPNYGSWAKEFTLLHFMPDWPARRYLVYLSPRFVNSVFKKTHNKAVRNGFACDRSGDHGTRKNKVH